LWMLKRQIIRDRRQFLTLIGFNALSWYRKSIAPQIMSLARP
jgi:hypothetical protein